MAAPRLDALPTEVLRTLCDHLQASHSPSVAQLALVNRQCRRAAAFALFRRISLQIESPQKLAADVQRWTSILYTNDSFRHVRSLVVRGNIWLESRRNAHKQTTDSAGRRLPPFTYEDSWLPLASFLEKLAGLKDIDFACESGFPSCLLSVLHSDIFSACRIHIGHFRLSGLVCDITKSQSSPLELRPNELDLVTSPNLHAIKLSGHEFTSTGKADYHYEALLDLVSSASSSLREVEYSHRRLQDTPALRKTRRPGTYPGLVLPGRSEKNQQAKAKLIRLTLIGWHHILEEWCERTDLSALRTLKLSHNVDASTLEWAAEHANFPSLSALEIGSIARNNELATATLLQSLSALNELTVLGKVNSFTFGAIVDHHGRSLQRLSIPGSASSIESLRTLNRACSCLEHLEIRTSRTKGDDVEVQLYASLGTFLRLRTLRLNLDCAITIADESTLDDLSWACIRKDPSYKQLCARRVLVNCAIDAALVAAIFRHIMAAKCKVASQSLELEINVVRAGIICFGDAEISAGEISSPYPGFDTVKLDGVYRHFERQWKCIPHPRDDRPGEVITEELQSSLAKRKRFEGACGGKPPELGDLGPEFAALWPREKGQDWRDVWNSLPLAEMQLHHAAPGLHSRDAMEGPPSFFIL